MVPSQGSLWKAMALPCLTLEPKTRNQKPFNQKPRNLRTSAKLHPCDAAFLHSLHLRLFILQGIRELPRIHHLVLVQLRELLKCHLVEHEIAWVVSRWDKLTILPFSNHQRSWQNCLSQQQCLLSRAWRCCRHNSNWATLVAVLGPDLPGLAFENLLGKVVLHQQARSDWHGNWQVATWHKLTRYPNLCQNQPAKCSFNCKLGKFWTWLHLACNQPRTKNQKPRTKNQLPPKTKNQLAPSSLPPSLPPLPSY